MKEIHTKLPSRFQIGEKVELAFYGNGEVKNCEVIKVHFTESKVLYDVQVAELTRLYNVDSCYVIKEREYIPIEEEPILNTK